MYSIGAVFLYKEEKRMETTTKLIHNHSRQNTKRQRLFAVLDVMLKSGQLTKDEYKFLALNADKLIEMYRQYSWATCKDLV